MAAIPARRTLGQLLKQGYNEIPEIICSTGIAFIGLGFAAIGLYKYSKNDGDNRRYKMTYVIMRPDDPKVKLIRKD